MIIFNVDKEKKLKFDLDVQGIDSKMLEYYIRLSGENVDLGFKGDLTKNGILEFTIPSLGGIIKESKIKNLKTIKIEVHDKDNKYYLKPMEDVISFEDTPIIKATVTEKKAVKKDINVDLLNDENKDKVVPKKKKSKISEFLIN